MESTGSHPESCIADVIQLRRPTWANSSSKQILHTAHLLHKPAKAIIFIPNHCFSIDLISSCIKIESGGAMVINIQFSWLKKNLKDLIVEE